MIQINDEIYRMRKSGIYCIQNDVYKLMYISHSSNFLVSLGRKLLDTKLEQLLKGYTNCSFKILHTDLNRKNRTAYLTKYINEYKDNYTIVGNPPKSTVYKLRIRRRRLKDFSGKTWLYTVELVAHMSNVNVIGVFNNLQEAEHWVISVYGTLHPQLPLIHYSTNQLTIDYLHSLNNIF